MKPSVFVDSHCAVTANGIHRRKSGEVSDFCEACGLIFLVKRGKPRKKLSDRGILRELLAERFGAICFYCGHDLVLDFRFGLGQWDATIDHKMPRCRGGSNNIDNLCLACKECNAAKADRTVEEWRALGFPRRRNFAEGTFVPVETLA